MYNLDAHPAATWRRLLVSGLALGLLAGGSQAVVAQDAAGDTVTLTDFRGKTMDVPVGTDSVVFLVENAMNTFYAVGGADNISGIGTLWQPTYKVAFFAGVDPDLRGHARHLDRRRRGRPRGAGGDRPGARRALVGRHRRQGHHGHREQPGHPRLRRLPDLVRRPHQADRGHGRHRGRSRARRGGRGPDRVRDGRHHRHLVGHPRGRAAHRLLDVGRRLRHRRHRLHGRRPHHRGRRHQRRRHLGRSGQDRGAPGAADGDHRGARPRRHLHVVQPRDRSRGHHRRRARSRASTSAPGAASRRCRTVASSSSTTRSCTTS